MAEAARDARRLACAAMNASPPGRAGAAGPSLAVAAPGGAAAGLHLASAAEPRRAPGRAAHPRPAHDRRAPGSSTRTGATVRFLGVDLGGHGQGRRPARAARPSSRRGAPGGRRRRPAPTATSTTGGSTPSASRSPGRTCSPTSRRCRATPSPTRAGTPSTSTRWTRSCTGSPSRGIAVILHMSQSHWSPAFGNLTTNKGSVKCAGVGMPDWLYAGVHRRDRGAPLVLRRRGPPAGAVRRRLEDGRRAVRLERPGGGRRHDERAVHQEPAHARRAPPRPAVPDPRDGHPVGQPAHPARVPGQPVPERAGRAASR